MATGAAATAAAPSLVKVSFGALPGSPPWAEGPGNVAGPIRLSRNENAYGPSAGVTAAMRDVALNAANRYPELEAEALRDRLADFHRVSREQIVLGCGAGEIMRMAVDAFLGSRKKLLTALPTFDLISQFARRAGAEVVPVALSKDYSHDLDAMLSRVNGSAGSAGLVYICNPNNPTGSLTRRGDIERFIQALPRETHVLIDEAYHHYVSPSAEYASFIERRVADDRVIVARTFSKIYGLAGLRVGYAVAPASTARLLNSYRLADPLNVVGAAAAMAALNDTGYVHESMQRNLDDRQEFLNQANARMVRAIDSHTNFVMLNTGRPASEVIEHFRENNIRLPEPFPSFDDYIRISMGTTAEMAEFWRVWDLMGIHNMSHE
jgi:histidinol-phosphate aminotransferase